MSGQKVSYSTYVKLDIVSAPDWISIGYSTGIGGRLPSSELLSCRLHTRQRVVIKDDLNACVLKLTQASLLNRESIES